MRLDDIRDEYYNPKDEPDPQCPKCGSFRVEVVKPEEESVLGWEYLCECGERWA